MKAKWYSLVLAAGIGSLASSGWAQTIQTNLSVIVRHAPSLNGGTNQGSLQQLNGESATVNSGFMMPGDWLLPGTPTLVTNGRPTFAGIFAGSGSTSPSGYQVMLNSGCSLNYLRTRTTPVALPTVSAPPSPTGTRSVTISTSGQTYGDAATLQNLTLNAGVGMQSVPPGTYGTFSVNNGSGLILGVAGSNSAVRYNLQNLNLNSGSTVKVVGPVILTVAYGFTVNGVLGASNNPAWLQVQIASGGFTLNSGSTVYGLVTAPAGQVTVNGNSVLVGTSASDQFTLNSGGLVKWSGGTTTPPTLPPVATNQVITLAENSSTNLTLTAGDPQGLSLTYTIATQPAHGILSGTPPSVTYRPATNYYGSDAFTFTANNGVTSSVPATVSLVVTQVYYAPVALSQSLTNLEDTALPITLTGTDPQGYALTYTVLTAPTHGTLSGTAPNLAYQPAPNYDGADQFTFCVNNGLSNSALATVSLWMLPVDDAPLVVAGTNQLIVWPTQSVSLAGTVVYDNFPGTVDTVAWSVVSGPGSVTFSQPTNVQTTATFSQPGVYQLRLTASDSFLSGSGDVFITVDVPPVVSAGPMVTNTFPGTVVLAGVVTDDGLPVNSQVTASWSVVSGPGTVVFGNPAQTNSAVTFSTNGVYVLKLTADDGVATNSARVTVIENLPPVVNAGASILTNGLLVHVQGSVSDDGLPGNTISAQWTQVSGPGVIAFGDATATNTSVGASQSGTYVLLLTATDGAATNSSELTVTFNLPPVVNAGAAQTVNQGTTVTLAGVVTDDQLPNNTLTSTWTQTSGPGTATFANAQQTNTTVTFDAPGLYVLQLTGNDSLASTSAEVVIQVNAVPMVDAGTNQIVALNVPATLAGTVVDDGLSGQPLVVQWTQVSGPSVASILTPAQTNTSVNFSQPGAYVFQLTADDGLTNASATVNIVVDQGPVLALNAPVVVTWPVNQLNLSGLIQDDGQPINGTLTATWSQAGGPASVAFSTVTTSYSLAGQAVSQPVSTVATFGASGVYSLQLTANDGLMTTATNFTVVVNAAPVVSAGTAQTVSAPDTAITLNGAATDDGLPVGGGLTTTWTVVSGTGTVTFGDATVTNTTARFSQAGTYVLRLTASDSLAATSSDIVITVQSVAKNPTVTIVTPTDGAQFSLGQAIPIQITTTSGGGAVTNITVWDNDVMLAQTNAPEFALTWTNGSVDSHVLSVAAMDDNGYTSVTSSITVFIVSTNESGFVVDAGADQVIEFSQSAALSGSLDFLDAPVDGQTNVLWRKVSGPDNVQFSDASALNASVSFGSPGSYTLQLSVSYNGSVENDTLVVTVLSMPAKKLIAPRSTKGADIWMTFLYQSITTSGDDPNFNTVVLAADTDAEVQLEYSVYPGYDNGYIQTNYLHVTGGQTLSVPLTLGFGYDDLLNNLVTTNAVHISANVPVTAYGFTRDSWSADGYQALPTAMLGTNYIVLSYAGYYSTFALLATEDNTHVTVTPTVDIDGWSAGETRELVLQRGQTYRTQKSSQVSGIVDFTGTTIVSDKPVAVYGGDTIAFVPTNCPWGDFLIEQMPPVNIWGQHFATMPLDGRSGGDTFRCLASQDGTQVSINGKVMATLGHGQFYEQIIDGPSIILATKPILVAQYANGSTYDGMLGDPFMMLIVPVEQYGGNCLLDALSLVGSRHYWEDPGWNTVDGVDYISYMNLIVYGQGTNDVWLDGQSVSADLFQRIGGSEYYGAQVAISNGTHSVSSAFPIQACVYGWAYTESYAYSSGFNTDIMEDDTQVALTQTTAYAVVGQEKTAMAKVTNGRGLPIADVEVPFRVLGTNQAAAWIRTARNGIARFTYTGTNSGIDIISVNLGSLTNSVTNTWLMPGGNQTPMVFTTNTQPVQAGLNIQLMGTVIDDGLPAGAPLKVRWQLLDGPGDVTFENPDQVRTRAACTKPGTYLFELTADDTQFSRSTVVSVVADYAPEITFPTTDIPSVVVVGSSVQLSARAGDANGLVVKVEFYANDQLIGTVTNGATGWQGFNLNWVPAQSGVMDLYAIAYDDVGVSSTSSVVTVESDIPPAVAIDNLTSGNVVFVPTNVPIHAVASDLDGVVTNLSIYVNGELLGTATNGELTAFWQPRRAGDYTLSAVATDEWGISTTSDNITVTVAGVFPVVTITNPVPNTYWGGYSTPIGKPITLGVDAFIDSPYLITNVSFYARGSLIGSTTMPPYSLVWAPRSGYSTITVQAEAESGAIGEATIGVDAYLDASVSLVEPVNNQVVYVGQPVRFKLAERDPWNVLGSEIYNYYVNWGLVATAPASEVVYWTPSQPGNYTIEPYGVIGYAIYTYVNLIAINPPIQNIGIVSPADGDVLYASVRNPVQVSFDDATNAFDHLEVFADGVSLGQTTNTLFNWVPALNGSYVLSAKVYDHAGHAFDATNTVSVQVTTAPRPVVTIDSPVDGSRVRANAETVVAASLNDPAGIATNVQFYLDGALASQNSVYFVWTPTVLGAHSLQCIAFTADGDSITSAPVNVTVAVMNPPTVSILTPTNGQYFVAGSQPLFSAVANDSDGLVTNLVLTLDSMVVGGTNGGVLQVSTNLTPGWHDLAAQATDNDGLSTVSDPVRFFLDWGENLTLPTPDQLAANALSATEIQLTWSPVATNDLTQSVIVERWNGVTGAWNEIAVVAVTETNYLDSGLTPETNYRYRAAVADINGNRSAYTAEVNATTRTVVPNYTVIDLTTAISGLLTNAATRGNLLTNGAGLEHYDVRRTVALGAAHANAVLGSNAAPLFKAVAAFKQRWPQIQLDYDPALLSPQSILPRVGFLTGPGGSGVTVSAATAQMFDPNDPYQPVKAFVQEYSTLFGFGAEALGNAMVQRDYVSAQTGARTVVWQQQVAGIPVFDALLSGHITADGELAGVACEFIPSPTQAVDPSVLSAVQGGYEFPVNGMQAVLTAVTNVGDDFGLSDFSTTSDSQGVTRNQSFTAAKGVKDTAHAELTWFPTSRNELKLAWQVIFTSSWRNEMYLTVISAVDNQVLFRRNLTADNAEASYRVYTSGSPAPMWPGLSTPGTTQAPLVDRTLVTLSAADATASPMGWLNDGGNVTVGNNVDAHLDRNDDNQSDLPYPTGVPADVFDFSLDLTGDPAGYGNAAVTQLFYWNNWMHDALYGLGFTEAAGNFQTDNYGRGGQGGDAVQADAQDGAGLNDGQHANNANMSTPPDGYAPRMQMYVFDGATPARDGCLDSSIVMHEYTHGLSSRLVGGGAGIDALQSAGMGEGWSDFYALALMVDPTSDPAGTYPLGAYATYHGFGTSFEQNYYYGIRHYPYCTDTNKNPLTLADIDPQHARIHLGVPRSPLMGTFSAAQASEVHNQGEVWCSMLWEVRAALVQKYGATAGNGLALQLVTDGLKLTPANPNFVQARDAILLADRIYSGGTNAPEIWAAFAKRGLGYNARVPESATSTGTQEAGDLQPALAVEQVEIQTTSGTIELGGINPLSIHLRNLGNAPAKQVSAQLTTTVAGVSIAQNLSGYADIAVSDAGTNTLPFVLQTGSDYVSGTAIDLTLTLTSDQGVITNYLRLFAGQPGAEILLDNFSATASPISQDSSSRDLTPWDLGNTEPLWLADNGSCLLKAGGKGKYILWKPDGVPQVIDNTNFLAHHMTRNGTVVGTLTLSNEVSVSSVTLSDAPYNGVVVTWTNIFPHTVGVRWDFTNNTPVPLTLGEYRWPKDAGMLSSVGNIYSSTLTNSFGQALYLTNTISYPKMQDVWDINANGVVVGAVSMQALYARQALSFDPVGNMDWFTAVELGLNAGQSDTNLGTQISFSVQFTTAAQFSSPDSGNGAWRWLGPLNWQSTLSYANLINDAGMVAGVGAVYFNDATLDSMQPTHAFRMPTSGECQPFASIGIDLGVLTNGLHSFPRAMNAQGALVGYSDFDITNTGGLSTSQLNAHAVYWGVTNTAPEWLTNFPPSSQAPYGFADAYGINDNNQVVGVSMATNSQLVGVLWQWNDNTNDVVTNNVSVMANAPYWEIATLNDRLTDSDWQVNTGVDINSNSWVLAKAQHLVRDSDGNIISSEKRAVLLVPAKIEIISRDPESGEYSYLGGEVAESDPVPEVDLQITAAHLDGSDLLADITCRVRDPLSEISGVAPLQELQFLVNGEVRETIPNLSSLASGEMAAVWQTRPSEVIIRKTIRISNVEAGVNTIQAKTGLNAGGNYGFAASAVVVDSDPSDQLYIAAIHNADFAPQGYVQPFVVRLTVSAAFKDQLKPGGTAKLILNGTEVAWVERPDFIPDAASPSGSSYLYLADNNQPRVFVLVDGLEGTGPTPSGSLGGPQFAVSIADRRQGTSYLAQSLTVELAPAPLQDQSASALSAAVSAAPTITPADFEAQTWRWYEVLFGEFGQRLKTAAVSDVQVQILFNQSLSRLNLKHWSLEDYTTDAYNAGRRPILRLDNYRLKNPINAAQAVYTALYQMFFVNWTTANGIADLHPSQKIPSGMDSEDAAYFEDVAYYRWGRLGDALGDAAFAGELALSLANEPANIVLSVADASDQWREGKRVAPVITASMAVIPGVFKVAKLARKGVEIHLPNGSRLAFGPAISDAAMKGFILLNTGDRVAAMRVLRPLIESGQITGDMVREMWDFKVIATKEREAAIRELEKGIEKLTGQPKPKNWAAHHDLPFQTGGKTPSVPNLQLEFLKRGLDCNDAALGGRFLPPDFHLKIIHFKKAGLPRGAWNYQWEKFFEFNPQATSGEIINFMKQLQNATSREATQGWTILDPYKIAWPFALP